MNNWDQITIGEAVEIGLLEKPLDGNHGEIHPKGDDFVDSGIPFIMASDIKNGKVDLENCSYITNSQAQSLRKGFSINGDVLLTHKATLGEVALLKTNYEFVMLTPQVTYYRVKDKEKLNNSFLKYYFESSFFQKTLHNYAGGSTRAYIGITKQLDLPLISPPLSEQKAIAKILTAFDDKIELLQAQNKTLETMAQTIFKEWFGKYQIGDELPEGWRVSSLSEIADFLNGLALQKYPPKKGHETLPVIKIRELKQGITSNTDRANTELDDKYVIDNGDVLFSWSGSLEVVIWQYGKGALNQHLFKVSSEIYPKWFYYHWVLHHLKEFKGIASSKATTMGHINRKHLDLAQVIVPDNKTFKRLDFLFSPILEKLENNQNQIQSLTKTRDTLLPKLMSGQVRVKNIKHTADA